MNRKTLQRIFILMLVAASFVVFISYKQAKPSIVKECAEGEKCDQKKTQADLILLESLTKHLLSSTDN
jgi:hypothetical protein